jgi:hypothetical protein
LKVPAISVLEFDVAGGNGLLFLDQFAKRVGDEVGVQIKMLPSTWEDESALKELVVEAGPHLYTNTRSLSLLDGV